MKKVHFSGIGGVAMIGGAFLAKQIGYEVRGSDNPLYPPTSELLKRLKVPIYQGYKPTNLDWNPDCVIVGNALSRGNAEIEEILNRRLRYISLPEWLKLEILHRRIPIVISGTHGKTTTTSLIAWILKVNNYTPGYLVGGLPIDFEYPAELGQDRGFFVIEGDEYDSAFFDKRPKFLHYLPQFLAITSIEYDHSDIYDNIEEIKNAFGMLLRTVPSNGLVLLNSNIEISILKSYTFLNFETFGHEDTSDWQCKYSSHGNEKKQIEVIYKDKILGYLEPILIGRHNSLNVLCAVAVCYHIGLNFDQIQKGVATFRGVRRRQEVFLEFGGNIFIDDFAHHPTAIRSTLEAIRERYEGRKIIVIFEPRSNTMVTNIFQLELGEALAFADEVLITPIYREEKIPLEKRLNRVMLKDELIRRGKKCYCARDFEEIYQYICNQIEGPSVVVIMSNGSCGNLRERLEYEFSPNSKKYSY